MSNWWGLTRQLSCALLRVKCKCYNRWRNPCITKSFTLLSFMFSSKSSILQLAPNISSHTIFIHLLIIFIYTQIFQFLSINILYKHGPYFLIIVFFSYFLVLFCIATQAFCNIRYIPITNYSFVGVIAQCTLNIRTVYMRIK